jgi:hypothetical protein
MTAQPLFKRDLRGDLCAHQCSLRTFIYGKPFGLFSQTPFPDIESVSILDHREKNRKFLGHIEATFVAHGLAPFVTLAGVLGAYADFLHTPQVPPSFAQCLQYLQFLHALQGSLPVQVEREAPEAMEMSKAQRRAFGQRVVMETSGIRLEC